MTQGLALINHYLYQYRIYIRNLLLYHCGRYSIYDDIFNRNKRYQKKDSTKAYR